MFSFVLIADTHVRARTSNPDNEYPSDENSKQRVISVVEQVNTLSPDFVIHLGDITHPIPAMPHYTGAVQLAKEIFKSIKCPVHYTPGNHDTCDKTHAFATAPTVNETSHLDFEKNWDQAYRSFDHQDCHFILIDSTILNSGLPNESAQKIWLENDLKLNQHKRLFLMMHYPLYIFSSEEHEHYDNIGHTARQWLLSLIKSYNVKAVFSGHSHYFFYNHFHNTQLYTLPSTTFVRPDFSDSTTIAPSGEFGRDDTDKLGFFHVQVTENDFFVTPIRSSSSTVTKNQTKALTNQVASGSLQNTGVMLRHNWAKPIDLPFDSLDEFNRKPVRNDYMLYGLMELGIKKIRIPLLDLDDPITNQRIQAFCALGFEFTFFSAGLPDAKCQNLILENQKWIRSLEWIVTRHESTQLTSFCNVIEHKTQIPIFLSAIKTYAENSNDTNFVFSHFLKHGFLPQELPEIESYFINSSLPKMVRGLVFSVESQCDLSAQIHNIKSFSERTNTHSFLHLKMPRLSEGRCFTDDAVIAKVVCEAQKLAEHTSHLTLFFDTFMDHDRGYNPRHGLLDKNGNPRAAYRALLLGNTMK